MSSITPHRSDHDGPRPRLVISTHDCILRLAYLPDGRRIVTGSGDGNVKVWNLENGEQEGTSMEHESEICGLAVTRDSTKIISCDAEGNIKVWDVESHESVQEWTRPRSCPEIALSPDDRLISVGDRTVAIYTMEGRQVKHSFNVDKGVLSMRFSPDGQKLACGTRGDIHV
jgi:WD40 repeat protein